jgi:hypothetical protein
MTDLRRIDPQPLKSRFAGAKSHGGDRPELAWLKISALRIDPRYQREISQRGEANILSIAEKFFWARFEPLMVARAANGLYAVINGQHRATAAALCGFTEVPCAIVDIDLQQQAESFVAINGDVTAMTPLQLFQAKLAAGDAQAKALAAACGEGGVTICRYPVPANKIKVGETLAVSMLAGLLKKYGRAVLVAALSCITQTRKGNPGMIRAGIVEALCAVLEAEPAWHADVKQLVFAMQTFDFQAEFNKARTTAINDGVKVSIVLVEAIGAHLEDRFAAAPAQGKGKR